MCDTCGCNITPGNRHLIEEGGKHAHTSDDHVAIEVLENLLSENDHQAAHNREHFEKHSVLAINLMSSPGSGKTRLLERTIDHLKGRYKIAVIEGDLETENDAQRIRDKGVPAIQITTGTACHLDAHMIHQALHQTPLNELDLLFIENVGNLVCPASFDLGQHLNVTLLSVTEGDDKPAKYPVIFRAADHVLITKSDLLPLLDDFNPDNAGQSLQQLAYKNPITLISAKSDQGMDEWLAWLEAQISQTKTNSTELETASL
ncbi:MAG: hydrogenase nickel incorporation protein HypB [Candidatus Thiodiazotropha sp.]